MLSGYERTQRTSPVINWVKSYLCYRKCNTCLTIAKVNFQCSKHTHTNNLNDALVFFQIKGKSESLRHQFYPKYLLVQRISSNARLKSHYQNAGYDYSNISIVASLLNIYSSVPGPLLRHGTKQEPFSSVFLYILYEGNLVSF